MGWKRREKQCEKKGKGVAHRDIERLICQNDSKRTKLIGNTRLLFASDKRHNEIAWILLLRSSGEYFSRG